MRTTLVLRMLAAVLGIVAVFLIPGLLMSALAGQQTVALAFLATLLGAWAFAGGVFLLTNGHAGELGVRGGFLVVSLSWAGCALLGAFPFFLSGAIPSFTDAFFESMSGFTTTGASILEDIESVPRALLLWRSTTHWLGGMGIIVLSVAVLPLLGIRGGQLVKAEAPWPTVDKITPKNYRDRQDTLAGISRSDSVTGRTPALRRPGSLRFGDSHVRHHGDRRLLSEKQ